MIYTSYLAKSANDPRAVVISRYPPKWYKGTIFSKLAPKKEWFIEWKNNPELGEDWYRKKYYETVLDHLDVYKTAKYLQDKILLCYESPEKFCHRHIAAEWLREAGYEVEEIQHVLKRK